jgi:hypothetical protein
MAPASLGWLPPGMLHHTTRVSADHFELLYVPQRASVPSGEVHVEAWPAGLATWQSPGAEQYEFQDAAPVNGRGAQWRPLGHDSGLLRWEYLPGAWAQVAVHGLAGDPSAVARRVAQGVRFDAPERVRLPWRLTGLPADLAVSSLQVIEDGSYQPWRAEIVFTHSSTDPLEHAPWLIVRANKGPRSPDPAGRPAPNTTVRGHQAELVTGDGDARLTVFRADDVVHQVSASGPALSLLGLEPDGLPALVEQFELLGDPPTWTDRPLD